MLVAMICVSEDLRRKPLQEAKAARYHGPWCSVRSCERKHAERHLCSLPRAVARYLCGWPAASRSLRCAAWVCRMDIATPANELIIPDFEKG